jgi:hypothetical protein
MLSGPFCPGPIRETGRKSEGGGTILFKSLIIKTLWRSERDSNSKDPFKAKVYEFPREFQHMFA